MSLGYKLFPSHGRERDQLIEACKFLNARIAALKSENENLSDQLAAKTLEHAALQAKLNGMQKPVPLEPTTIKVGTAADVRRIVEQQNFRDEQENSDGRA